MTSPTRRGAPNSVAAPTVRQSPLEPVTRRYRPASAALDELVDALYQLLMTVPADASGTTSPPSGIGLLSGGARVRNVS
jgi:hypothetical protein